MMLTVFCVWPVLDMKEQMNGIAVPLRRIFFYQIASAKRMKTDYRRARWYRNTVH